jgi:U-box domain/C2 domain
MAASKSNDSDIYTSEDDDILTSYLSDSDLDTLKKSAKGKQKGNLKDDVEEESCYIVGTLIVRVVAARNLAGSGLIRYPLKQSHRRIINTTTIYNPYASVQFCGQSQRTSAVPDSTDPLWPRSEAMYLDVSLPLSQVTYRTSTQFHSGDTSSTVDAARTAIPPPILTVSLFHASGDTHLKNTSFQKVKSGDSDDHFLGTASLDVTPLITGKRSTMDRWLTLSGTNHQQGSVRLVCEYEPSDPPPHIGDSVCFNRFCHPQDLFPIPITLSYKVLEVDHDDIILEYTTPEGWICTFVAHRFMVICEERHQAVLEICQDELLSITERLGCSPMVREVQSTIERVPEEGLLFVGFDAIQGAGSILDRWWKGGIETAIGDLQYVTNWDGRFNQIVNLDTDSISNDDSLIQSTPSISLTPSYRHISEDAAALPGMPCCPITGEPMIDPVVAADGHTYERYAIARWLQTSDKSPLTGSLLMHKNLVPNYMLLSSLQEVADVGLLSASDQQQQTQNLSDDENKKMSPS